MTSSDLWAGALSQLLLHHETGCRHSAHHAAHLLDRLSESEDLDATTRGLCERASARLTTLSLTTRTEPLRRAS